VRALPKSFPIGRKRGVEKGRKSRMCTNSLFASNGDEGEKRGSERLPSDAGRGEKTEGEKDRHP